MASPTGLKTSARLPTCENGRGRSVQKFTGGVGRNKNCLGRLVAKAKTRCERRVLVTLCCHLPLGAYRPAGEGDWERCWDRPRDFNLLGTAVTHNDPKRTAQHLVYQSLLGHLR